MSPLLAPRRGDRPSLSPLGLLILLATPGGPYGPPTTWTFYVPLGRKWAHCNHLVTVGYSFHLYDVGRFTSHSPTSPTSTNDNHIHLQPRLDSRIEELLELGGRLV